MASPLILLLSLLIAATVAKGIHHNNQTTSQAKRWYRSLDENLIFSTPELIANFREPNDLELYLEAFKTKENDQTLLEIASNPGRAKNLMFISMGEPQIVGPPLKERPKSALIFTPSGFSFHVQLLAHPYRQALADAASAKYQTSVKIKPSQIVLLNPDSFTCDVEVTSPSGLTALMRGQVIQFREDPLEVDFKVSRNSPAYKMIQAAGNEVEIECRVTKRAQKEHKDQLIITSHQMDQLNLENKLFGAADSVFVSRQQLNELGREVMQKLNIFESYESEGFESNFVTEILAGFGVQNAFTPRPIAEVLAGLSRYNINSDLRPDEIIKDFSDVLKIESTGGKVHVVANKESSQLKKEDKAESGSVAASGEGFGFGASVSANWATSKSDEWAKSGKSVDDQLNEMNKYSQSAIKFEREGMKIVPKSLDVAQISRSKMSRSMSFERIRRKLTSADFQREFELTLPTSEEMLVTTTTTTTTTTTKTTTVTTPAKTTTTTTPATTTTRKSCPVNGIERCQTSSDCCKWYTRDFKLIRYCADDKTCKCVNQGDKCDGMKYCCDGSTCDGSCPPGGYGDYCSLHHKHKTTCQTGNPMIWCIMDDVLLALWPTWHPDSSKHGRCVPGKKNTPFAIENSVNTEYIPFPLNN